MKLIYFLPIFFTLFFCAGNKYKEIPVNNSNKYISKEYNFEIELPGESKWKVKEEKVGDIVFEADNIGKILYVFVAVESLNSDIEDYYLLLKLSNKLDQQKGVNLIGENIGILNGEKYLKFVYTADIEDEKIGLRNFTYTNVLLKKFGLNYRLMIYTLTDGFERKKELINDIIERFRFIKK